MYLSIFSNKDISDFYYELPEPLILTKKHEVALCDLQIPTDFTINFGSVKIKYPEYLSTKNEQILNAYNNNHEFTEKTEISLIDDLNKIYKNRIESEIDSIERISLRNELIDQITIVGYENIATTIKLFNRHFNKLKIEFYNSENNNYIYKEEIFNLEFHTKASIFTDSILEKIFQNYSNLFYIDSVSLIAKTNVKISVEGDLLNNYFVNKDNKLTAQYRRIIKFNNFNIAIGLDCIDTSANNEKYLKIIKVNSVNEDIIDKEFIKLHYLPVNKTYINRINIRLMDSLGNKLYFDKGFVYLKLHFKVKK